MTTRLLFIALDAADCRLLEAWSQDGTLPNIARLRGRGMMRHLASRPEATDDSIWASLQFGTPLAEHGRYHHVVPLRTGQVGPAHLADGDRDPFWVALSQQGARVAILDLPKCAPPKPLNGIHLIDWLVHGRYFGQPRSHPPDLAQAIVERFGAAPPSRCDYFQEALSDDEGHAFVDSMLGSIAQKRAAGLHFLASEPWDLFAIGFKEAHCTGHGLLNLIDSRHREHDPARNARLGDPVRRIFQSLDAAIGDLAACAGPNAEVALFSTTDMVPNGSIFHLTPQLVTRIDGYLRTRHGPPPRRPNGEAVDKYCASVPYSESACALRIRRLALKVDPQRYPDLLDEIEALMSELRDIDSGEPVIASFARPFLEQKGPRAQRLPDLIALCRRNAFPRGVVSQRLGRIEAETRRMRPGNHDGGGLLIAGGRRAAAAAGNVAMPSDIAGFVRDVLAVPSVMPGPMRVLAEQEA